MDDGVWLYPDHPVTGRIQDMRDHLALLESFEFKDEFIVMDIAFAKKFIAEMELEGEEVDQAA